MYQETRVIGRIGKDITYSNNFAKIVVAVSEKYKDKERTEWFRFVAFGKVAEIINKYAKKGDLIHLIGKKSTSSYEKDGVTKYSEEFIVTGFNFIPNGKKEKLQNNQPDISTTDEIPF